MCGRASAYDRPSREIVKSTFRIFTHGGVISVYACYLLGCSFNDLWRLRVDNASVTVVRPPRLVSLNDTAHLGGDLAPAHLQRASLAARPSP